MLDIFVRLVRLPTCFQTTVQWVDLVLRGITAYAVLRRQSSAQEERSCLALKIQEESFMTESIISAIHVQMAKLVMELVFKTLHLT
jgi:hypothetical protein